MCLYFFRFIFVITDVLKLLLIFWANSELVWIEFTHTHKTTPQKTTHVNVLPHVHILSTYTVTRQLYGKSLCTLGPIRNRFSTLIKLFFAWPGVFPAACNQFNLYRCRIPILGVDFAQCSRANSSSGPKIISHQALQKLGCQVFSKIGKDMTRDGQIAAKILTLNGKRLRIETSSLLKRYINQNKMGSGLEHQFYFPIYWE